MLKNLKNSLITLVAVLGIVTVPLAYSGVVSADADIQGSLCEGSDLKFGGNQDCTNTDGSSAEGKVNDLVTKIVNIVSVVVAIVAVIMIIFGGFKYITSSGDSNKVTSAKNTILYAIIGLVIVAFAQFIVKFVIGKTSGVATTSGG